MRSLRYALIVDTPADISASRMCLLRTDAARNARISASEVSAQTAAFGAMRSNAGISSHNLPRLATWAQ
jgi:hypothetical protein